ncbi:MAG: hypothetical protein J6S04_05425 [Clostridia bacterium]|nr:hypothetical protein [Clostridia bacterium]
MFDWLWHLLYQITKTLFRLIDGLVQCANYLCGVSPITVDGVEVDFLQYILTSDQIGFAFRVAALLGMIIVVIFAIIAILRTLAKEKAEGTPMQIAGKAIKSVLSFLFIPMIMIVVMNAGNIFMKAMYDATMQGQNSLGDFLFKAFAMESMKNMGIMDAEVKVDAFLADPNLDWRNTFDVWKLMDLSEFEFIFSWIAGAVILGCIGMSMMYFVSRLISITILYIAAPFSIGSSVLDDGARFKLWREQILIKFITGYGMMLAINVFAMICLLVMNPSLIFFEQGSFIDYVMKLLIIAGGGVSLKQSMALIGNLVSSGGGSNELRDAAVAGGLGGMIGRIPGAGILGGVGSSMKQEITGKAAQKILPSWAQRSYGGGGKGGKDEKGGKDKKDDKSKNDNLLVSAGKNSAKKAITGDDKGGNKSGGKDDKSENTNDKKPEGNGQGSNLVNDAISQSGQGSGGKGGGGYDDLYDD